MRLRRPTPIHFDRADGSRISTPPPTREQMRAVYALDPAQRTQKMELSEQRAAQVAILLAHATCTGPDGAVQSLAAALGSLAAEEETDILIGLSAVHHGLDPEDAVTAQAALRSLIKKKARARSKPAKSS